jgi:branched-chain amino acid aminotransferase
LRYKDYIMEFNTDEWKTAPAIKTKLNAIRYGQLPDTYEWMYKI